MLSTDNSYLVEWEDNSLEIDIAVNDTREGTLVTRISLNALVSIFNLWTL